MKIRILKLAGLSFSLLAILTSCNKTPDVTPQFQRCGNSLALANNGNLIIAGYNSTNSYGYDAALVMANPATGDTLWSKTYGSSYSDAFYSVKRSNNGGIVAVGFSNKGNASAPAMLMVITDIQGKLVKSKTYGGSAWSQGFCVIPNADSGYLIAGYIQKTSSSDRNIYLVRTNDSGDTLWTKSLGAQSTNQYDTVNDAAYSVVAAPDGGYFVTGSLNVNGYSQNSGRIFLKKITSTGNEIWTKTYGIGLGYSVTLTHENGNGVANGIAISGSLQEGSNEDIFLLKTDLDGKQLWAKSYGGSGFEYGANMIETSGGGFAITGITDSKGSGFQDVYLILTDASGTPVAEPTYGGTDNDQGFGLVEMPDKGFCITGLSNSGGSYIFLNRVNANGSQFWASPKYIE
jgi:hypothetical protein